MRITKKREAAKDLGSDISSQFTQLSSIPNIDSSKKALSFQKNKLFLEDSSADTQKSSKKLKPPVKQEKYASNTIVKANLSQILSSIEDSLLQGFELQDRFGQSFKTDQIDLDAECSKIAKVYT